MSQPGPPKYLFENVLDFAASQGRGNVGAFCMRSQRRHSAPATDIVYMGFSCKDVSRLNVNRIASGGCIRDRSLRTGSTLDGGMCYVVARRPRLVLLENVASLDDASKSSGLSNADDLFAHFSKMGHYLVSAIYDARKHGAVQRRTRWWGIAMRIALDDGDSERCKLWAEEILKTLSEVELEPANFENILMPENSEDLSEWPKAGVAAPEDDDSRTIKPASKKVAAEWPALHAESFRCKGLRYPVRLELFYSAWELGRLSVLPARCQEVVAWFDMTLGRVQHDADEQVIDVSQSINRAPWAVAASTCVVPRGMMWLRKRFRLMQPNEGLAAQGFPLYTRRQLSAFSESEVADLAGNTFCSHTALAFIVAALATAKLTGE